MVESFGIVLQKAREARGIDLDRASKETSISKKYLECLEKEQLTFLPGETYVKGFLLNYAEYLQLNPTEIMGLYEKTKVQLSTTPLNLLLEPKKRFPWHIVIAGFFAVILIATVAILATISNKKKEAQRQEIISSIPKQSVYFLDTTPIERRIYIDDKIQVKLENEIVELTVKNTLDSLQLETPQGIQIIELGEETEIDLDGQPGGEILLFLEEISKVDATRGAQVHMMVLSPDSNGSYTFETNTSNEIDTDSIAETNAITQNKKIIFDDTKAYPITLDATFRTVCLFRYKIDNRDSVETYITAGENITVTANNGIRIWMSNANAVTMKIIGDGKTVDLEPGRPGQILVEDIKWIKEDDKYKLVVINVD